MPENRLKKIYEWLFVISPWVFFAGLLQFHFQRFLPLNRLFMGAHFFDYVTVIDFLVILIFVLFLSGYAKGRLAWNDNKLGWPFKLVVMLLILAAILQLLLQKVYEPVLVTPTEYLRSLFVFPLIFTVLAYRTLSGEVIKRMVKSYALMASFFCILALLQYFTGWFPGEQNDFMGRLVWPYVDFVTLKSASANWVAFFITPALIISFIFVWKKVDLRVYLPAFILTAVTVYMTQSYGAYAAAFAGAGLYLLRELKFKKFLAAGLVLVVAAVGIYLLQQNTMKFQVNYGDAEYRYANSVASRWDIYKMNGHILATRPLLGVGLNQYQSYFASNHKDVLGHDYGEVQIPPHAHNFFISFWTSLGLLGFLAMLILLIDLLWKSRLDPNNPAIFAFVGIMTHGLIDSYYWQQETAYIFWIIVLFIYLLRLTAIPLRQK